MLECDKEHHNKIQQMLDRQRKTQVMSELDCTWVSYKPSDPKFNVLDVIRNVHEAIVQSR